MQFNLIKIVCSPRRGYLIQNYRKFCTLSTRHRKTRCEYLSLRARYVTLAKNLNLLLTVLLASIIRILEQNISFLV